MKFNLNLEHHDDHLYAFVLELGWLLIIDGPRLKYQDPKSGDVASSLQIAAETALNRLVYESYDRSEIKASATKKPLVIKPGA